MDKQEKIVCAAIELEFILLHGGYIKSVFSGCNYKSIQSEWSFLTLVDAYDLNKFTEGFITNKNRFVDPIEAQQIAIACGQYRDPHIRIKSLEKSIEVGWDSVKYAKTSVMITSLKKQIAEDQAALEELKAGYLGNALRVEDLHYV